MIFAHIRELARYRELLISWTNRDFRLRYKQSLLGGLWAILQPMILMVLFTLVFSVIVHIPSDGFPYPVFAYTALLPWTYFANSLSFGTNTLVGNMNLVTKIYFPREILPIAAIGVSFFDFCIASIVLLFLMFFYNLQIQITLLWVPLLLVIQTAFIIGLTLITAMLNAFYRDIRFVIPLLMQVWLYATPIIYPLSAVPEWLLPYYFLNPMAGLIDSYRKVILHGVPPNPVPLGFAAAISALVLIIGYAFFKRWEEVLPDVI